jgi:hypothetical protein
MRLEINAGGLNSFFDGVNSFINAGSNAANGDRLINSIQKVANKTHDINGGVGVLGTALACMQKRKVVEEARKAAVQAVKVKTGSFVKTSVDVDNAVANIVSGSQEAFYQTNPWLRPPVPIFGDAAEWFDEALDNLVDFVCEHWEEIVVIAAVVATTVITVATFGAASPLLIAAVGAGIGALCGAAGQLISDVISGEWSSWQTYLGAIVGGAFDGAITAATSSLGPLGAAIGNVVGSLVGNLFESAINGEGWQSYVGMAVGGGAAIAVVSLLLPKGVSKVTTKVISKGIGEFSAEFSTGVIGNATGIEKSADEILLKSIFAGGVGALSAGAVGRIGPKISSVKKAGSVYKGVMKKVCKGSAKRISLKTFGKGLKSELSDKILSETTKSGATRLFAPVY